MLLRVRHRTKTPPKLGAAPVPVDPNDAAYVAGCADTAIRAEAMAADGLLALPPDVRKMNVHYTQVRTRNAKDVQPHQLTQAQFWDHTGQGNVMFEHNM